MYIKITVLFLRFSLAAGFLSAVADRFGVWSKEVSVWGNWNNFVAYTQLINPWFPKVLISPIAFLSTIAEIVFAFCLLIGFKTKLVAKLSGYLLLAFAFAMLFSTGAKAPLDYSVFSAAAAAFALSCINKSFLDVDILLKNK